MDAAFGLGIAIGILALDQHRRRFDPRLFARLIFDQLDLEAALFGPAAVHALEHFGPVLAFGAAGAGMDFDIGVVGVGFAREQRPDLVFFGARRERRQRGNRLIDHRLIAFHFGEFDQLGGVGAFTFDRARRGDCRIEPLPLAHHFLRRLGAVPQRRVLDLGIEFVEPPHGAVPVEETPQQRQRGANLVDMILRFGAHVLAPEIC